MITGPEVLAVAFGFVVGLAWRFGNSVTRIDYEHAIQQSDAQRLCRALSDTNICTLLAGKLEIQADGGDNPAEFVEWAIREVWSDVDNGKITKRKPMAKG